MASIMQLARGEGIAVIEDCAQAHGARFGGRPVGSWGDVGVFSFCQDKIMTTGGEGGLVVTDNREIWERAWSFKEHGKSHAAVQRSGGQPGFRWLHESFGSNYRLTEMQAAIGRRQLHKLDEWVRRRRRNAQVLEASLAAFDCLRVTRPPDDVYHAYYKYYTFVRPEHLRPGWSRDRIVQEFDRIGVPGLTGTCPEIYLQKAFQVAGLQPPHRLPVAAELGETSLQFLVHPTIDVQHMEMMADKVGQVLDAAQAAPRLRMGQQP